MANVIQPFDEHGPVVSPVLPNTGRAMGWKASRPSINDEKYRAHYAVPSVLPDRPRGMVKSAFPPIRDQKTLGSCTGHGWRTVLQYILKVLTGDDLELSPLAIYYFERQMERTVNTDAGAEVKHGGQVALNIGVPSEKAWPYDMSKFRVLPSDEAMSDVLQITAEGLYKCDNLEAILAALDAGHPVVGGFSCYSSMDTADVQRTGAIPYPTKGDKDEGGHCVAFLDYDIPSRVLPFPNSWGLNWGRKGWGGLPFQYVTNGLADDFWALVVKKPALVS